MGQDFEELLHILSFLKILRGEALSKADFLRFTGVLQSANIHVDTVTQEEWAGLRLRLRQAVARFMSDGN